MSLSPVSRIPGLGMTFCPPAGASVEVNEAAVSVAAPAASGQSAGIPSAGEWHVVDWLSRGMARVYAVRRESPGYHDYLRGPAGKVRRFKSADAARAALAQAEKGGTA